MIVVDASVIVKSYLKEKDSEKADTLLESHEILLAPSLIRIEVAAAFCKALRRNACTAKEALALFRHWENHLEQEMITLVPESDIIQTAMHIATNISHPLQDCLYLAASRLHNARLITADIKLFERAQKEKLDVRMLADYGVH